MHVLVHPPNHTQCDQKMVATSANACSISKSCISDVRAKEVDGVFPVARGMCFRNARSRRWSDALAFTIPDSAKDHSHHKLLSNSLYHVLCVDNFRLLKNFNSSRCEMFLYPCSSELLFKSTCVVNAARKTTAFLLATCQHHLFPHAFLMPTIPSVCERQLNLSLRTTSSASSLPLLKLLFPRNYPTNR